MGRLYHGTSLAYRESILKEGLKPPVWLTEFPLHARVYGPIVFEVKVNKLVKSLLQGVGQVRIYQALVKPEFLALKDVDLTKQRKRFSTR